MDLFMLFKGLIIGFSIAAPVGPIGVLCIRRTLAEGRMAGLVSGLGAATADALYGCVAGFGLTAVSNLLLSQSALLRLVGGLFLCYLGFTTFRTQPASATGDVVGTGLPARSGAAPATLRAAYGSTLLLTLTNPMTILSFAAIFAGLGLAGGAASGALLLVGGVFIGSALWWLLLSGSASLLRGALRPQHLRWINRGSGVVLLGTGLLSLLSLLPGLV